jgi:DNA-binding NtrC family response regulator
MGKMFSCRREEIRKGPEIKVLQNKEEWHRSCGENRCYIFNWQLFLLSLEKDYHMSRFSPRTKKEIEASIIHGNGEAESVLLKNMGLDGGYLVPIPGKGLFIPQTVPGSSLRLRIPLKDAAELAIMGQIVRMDEEGWGLSFPVIDRGDRIKIWNYLRESLIDERNCPYCNAPLALSSARCGRCEWDLNFGKEDYLAYWERESIIRKLTGALRNMSVESLGKVARHLEEAVLFLKSPLESEEIKEFVGTCPAMGRVFSLIRKVAPTDLPVLILGESGTGKELTAKAIHERSPRKDQPFVTINCSAIPESLIEAELFGYEKGAFTGAYTNKKGKFEIAHRGTLFLDEIGEFPVILQPKLLRFLETHLVEPIGSRRSVQVDVRIVAATNRDLESALAEERFRSDLYHRIKVFSIQLPPLREREEDKAILAHYFLHRIKREGTWSCKGFTPEALDAIRQHPWPGNVREMINRIRRAVVLQDEWIRPEDLELEAPQLVVKRPRLREANEHWKAELVELALREHSYNISQTARSLGISRPYLHQLIKKMGISIPPR